MREASLPFERRGGQTQQDATYNRIAALQRIKFLTGVDLLNKSPEYKKLIDSELYVRWYKDLPSDSPIDEDWCQRVAVVVKELETKDKNELEVVEQGADERVKELYRESQLKPSIPSEQNKVSDPQPISLFKRILTWNWNKPS